MIRIFFGQFYSTSVSATWNGAFTADHTFPMFLEGTQNSNSGFDYNVHKRIPQIAEYTEFDDYNEYLDLFHADIDTEYNEMALSWEDLAGVEQFVQIPTTNAVGSASKLGGGLVNKIVIETIKNEFNRKTRLISRPVPDVAKAMTPKLYGENRTLAADHSLAINGYVSFAVTQDPSVPALNQSYASNEVFIPYNSKTNDDIFLAIYNGEAYTTSTINLYRADVSKHLFSPSENEGEQNTVFTHEDMMLQLTPTISGIVDFGWLSLIVGSPFTAKFMNETTYPYAAKGPTTFCPFEPLNDAIARIGCDFYNRNRPDVPVIWLVLNTKTHKYYKGILLNVSPLFTEGFDAFSEDSAQITLGVTAEGSFVDAALDNPNNTDYFTTVNRSYAN